MRGTDRIYTRDQDGSHALADRGAGDRRFVQQRDGRQLSQVFRCGADHSEVDGARPLLCTREAGGFRSGVPQFW